MIDSQFLLLAVLVAVLGALALLVMLVLRRPEQALTQLREKLEDALRAEQRDGRGELRQALDALAASLTRDAQSARGEAGELQLRHNTALTQRIDELTERTDRRLDEFRLAIAEEAQRARREGAEQQQRFAEALGARLKELTDRNAHSIGELRLQVEHQLTRMQADSAQKLEQMRATVDEKLHATLETRLTESFGNVTQMLAQVHQGLGDMNKLAADVGGLQRVLTNVKSRGVFGEVQLAGLLEQVFAPDQYAANIATVPGSSERVEFAVRFPGSSEHATVWLPIDAKFPREDYERLLDAQERADPDAARQAGDALERRVREEAKRIRGKYVAPPQTTEFAVLFLPTEGLYAEVLRRPGLFEALQREQRITVAGPTTLLALLTSLHVGFRTVAIEQRSAEVWRVLARAKTEFGKFGDVLDNVKNKLDQASKQIESTGTRTRAIERSLRGVEVLPGEGVPALPEGDGGEVA